MAFPEPTNPIATCVASDCSDCPVSNDIHCHFRPKELLHFLLICVPGFVVGGAGILPFGDATRNRFFERNPSVAAQWGKPSRGAELS